MSTELTNLNLPQRVAFANQLAGQINEALDRAWKTAVVLGWELTRLKAELPHGEFGKLFENDSKSELWFRFSSRQARKYMELYTLCCEKAGQLGQAEALQTLLGAIHPAQSYRALPTPQLINSGSIRARSDIITSPEQELSVSCNELLAWTSSLTPQYCTNSKYVRQ